jgi:2',3'-cyclic-nucleotide 2'-phosphodiesterase (5'-nucleotidase family)
MRASLRWFVALWVFAAGTLAPVYVDAAQEARITILQTTDLHHHANGADHIGLDLDPVSGTSVIGAYARIAAYVNYVRTSARNPVLLVDSGDWTMGTLYDLTLGAQPLALHFLQLMRYDCVTLGNHEFDYGPAGLAHMLGTAQASFGFNTPIVASNMNLNGNAALEAFVGPDKAIQSMRIQELEIGLKVAYMDSWVAAQRSVRHSRHRSRSPILRRSTRRSRR